MRNKIITVNIIFNDRDLLITFSHIIYMNPTGSGSDVTGRSQSNGSGTSRRSSKASGGLIAPPPPTPHSLIKVGLFRVFDISRLDLIFPRSPSPSTPLAILISHLVRWGPRIGRLRELQTRGWRSELGVRKSISCLRVSRNCGFRLRLLLILMCFFCCTGILNVDVGFCNVGYGVHHLLWFVVCLLGLGFGCLISFFPFFFSVVNLLQGNRNCDCSCGESYIGA